MQEKDSLSLGFFFLSCCSLFLFYPSSSLAPNVKGQKENQPSYSDQVLLRY